MDKYTKAVLTIIAGCLVIQTGQSVIEPAHASNVQKIALCDQKGICADISSTGPYGKSYLMVEIKK